MSSIALSFRNADEHKLWTSKICIEMKVTIVKRFNFQLIVCHLKQFVIEYLTFQLQTQRHTTVRERHR